MDIKMKTEEQLNRVRAYQAKDNGNSYERKSIESCPNGRRADRQGRAGLRYLLASSEGAGGFHCRAV